MAWNPNVPTVTNRVQDDLDAIRENFQHLDPLAPYVQAILDSRIVDHNLDVADPPNGYYVRWDNGYQVCWSAEMLEYNGSTTLRSQSWVPAASFVEFPFIAHMPNTHLHFTNVPSSARQHLGGAFINVSSNFPSFNFDLYAAEGTFSSDDYMSTNVIAIGRWK